MILKVIMGIGVRIIVNQRITTLNWLFILLLRANVIIVDQRGLLDLLYSLFEVLKVVVGLIYPEIIHCPKPIRLYELSLLALWLDHLSINVILLTFLHKVELQAFPYVIISIWALWHIFEMVERTSLTVKMAGLFVNVFILVVLLLILYVIERLAIYIVDKEMHGPACQIIIITRINNFRFLNLLNQRYILYFWILQLYRFILVQRKRGKCVDMIVHSCNELLFIWRWKGIFLLFCWEDVLIWNTVFGSDHFAATVWCYNILEQYLLLFSRNCISWTVWVYIFHWMVHYVFCLLRKREDVRSPFLHHSLRTIL